jgi:non-ribosomal peptide synthase protein (TIGR01720 family)
LGGDSILSIQVVSRARERGLRITPRQMFQYPRLGELAAVSGEVAGVGEAEQGKVAGKAPLTPIQRWYFEQELAAPEHYNQSVLVEVKGGVGREDLKRALERLVEHHDALRLRFERTAGGWEQHYGEEVKVELAGQAGGLQEGMDLQAGPLVRAAYLEPDRLLLAIHHLVVDGVSWRILLEDLGRLLAGEGLPAKTSSYRQWGQALEQYGRAEPLRGELEYWREAAREGFRLPRDFEDGDNTEAALETVGVELDAERTGALLQQVPAAYHTEIDDVLLAALWKTLADWSGRRGVTVAREGHGREEIGAGLDVSRTVGWFTTVYPVRLEGLARDWPGGVLKQVKEQLRSVPRHGLGYGVLRYLGDRPLAGVEEPELSFNYLGQLDRGLGATAGRLALAAGERGRERSPLNRRDHLVDVTAAVTSGRLRVEWNFSRRLHRRETMERLANAYRRALEETIAHCLSPHAGGYTPSDFKDALLSQTEIDALMGELTARKEG